MLVNDERDIEYGQGDAVAIAEKGVYENGGFPRENVITLQETRWFVQFRTRSWELTSEVSGATPGEFIVTVIRNEQQDMQKITAQLRFVQPQPS